MNFTSGLVLFIVIAVSISTSSIHSNSALPTECSTISHFICRDCRFLEYCQDDGTTQLLFECPRGHACTHGACVPDSSNSCIPKYSIPCSNVGVFPDPIYCYRYHFCVKDEDQSEQNDWISTPEICENRHEFSYNPLTKNCDKNIRDFPCDDYPFPPCQSYGEFSKIDANPNLYYVCLNRSDELYPYQLSCQNGGAFDSEKQICIL